MKKREGKGRAYHWHGTVEGVRGWEDKGRTNVSDHGNPGQSPSISTASQSLWISEV